MKKCGIPSYKEYKHNSKDNKRDMAGYERTGKKKKYGILSHKRFKHKWKNEGQKRKTVRLSSHYYELCESRTAYKEWKRGLTSPVWVFIELRCERIMHENGYVLLHRSFKWGN